MQWFTQFHHCISSLAVINAIGGHQRYKIDEADRQSWPEGTPTQGALRAFEGVEPKLHFRDPSSTGSADDAGGISRRRVCGQSDCGAFDRVIRSIQWSAD
jgi:hypothetical protein